MGQEILIENKDEIFSSVKKAYILSAETIIRTVKNADIKGMGGAGFPTWIKWAAVKNASSSVKYVIANGHEGEPYTLKDKFLMSNFPHQIIAGMLIVARVVSSRNLFLVINTDYREEIKILKTAIKDFAEEGLLKNIDIRLSNAKKRYIGGEESALLNELEGKRIKPRAKTPLVCNCGLNGEPTVINNVETFAQIPYLIREGETNYKKYAKKLFTLAGDVKSPGVYEAKVNSSLNSIIKLAGGVSGKAKFAIVGGYSGNTILPKDFDKKINFCPALDEIYLGAGTVLVYNQQTKVLDVIKNLFEFYKNESCGLCVPCREGTMRIFEIISKSGDKVLSQDKIKIDELIFTIDNSSFCAFGQCVGMAAKGLFDHFRKELLGGK